jgi:hypothetical protein
VVKFTKGGTKMGNIAAAAYDIGVGAGLASFQASVEQNSLAAQALRDVQGAVEILANAGRFSSRDLLAEVQARGLSQSTLEQFREELETEISSHSIDSANAYRLGLVIAIAEGQTTSPDWQRACEISHDGLHSVERITRENFPDITFNNNLLQNALMQTENFARSRSDAHNAVLNLRLDYRDTILRAKLEE